MIHQIWERIYNKYEKQNDKQEFLSVFELSVKRMEMIISEKLNDKTGRKRFIGCNLDILDECRLMIYRDLELCFQMNSSHEKSILKFAGIMTHWVRKLKPFYFINVGTPLALGFPYSVMLNEMIALLTGMNFVNGSLNTKLSGSKIRLPAFWNSVLVAMRYESVSLHSITLMFFSLALEE